MTFEARASSPDRRRVLDAALGPEPVEPAGDAELGGGPDIALEHLAVVADVPDDADHPILGQPDLLAIVPSTPSMRRISGCLDFSASSMFF